MKRRRYCIVRTGEGVFPGSSGFVSAVRCRKWFAAANEMPWDDLNAGVKCKESKKKPTLEE